MLTEWGLYWLTRFDAIKMLLAACTGATAAGMFALVVWCGVEERPQYLKSYGPPLVAVLVLLGIVNTFTPTTREYAAIRVLPALAANKDVQDLGSGITELAKQWLEELKPKPHAEESAK